MFFLLYLLFFLGGGVVKLVSTYLFTDLEFSYITGLELRSIERNYLLI